MQKKIVEQYYEVEYLGACRSREVTRKTQQITFRYCAINQQETHSQWSSQAKRSTNKIRPSVIGGDIFGRFFSSNFDKCQPEVAGDVISGVSVGVGRYGCPYKIQCFMVEPFLGYTSCSLCAGQQQANDAVGQWKSSYKTEMIFGV